MNTLGLALIARNEEKNLARCLDSVQGLFDEIVVVDTGSTDKTKQVAIDHGAKVFDFEWIDDFSAARNFSFSKITCQYVMWLDCDDILLPNDVNQVKQLKENFQAEVYIMPYNYAQDEYGNSLILSPLPRILKNSPELIWHDECHEYLNYPMSYRIAQIPIIVSHRRSVNDQAKDGGRNLRILAKAVKKRPKESRLRFYYGKEMFFTGKWHDTINIFVEYLLNPDWHENQIHAYWLVGQCFMNLGKNEKALKTFLAGIKTDPRWAEFYNAIGQIYYNEAKWAEATRWFEIAKNLKVPDSLGFITIENYTWVPADRLCKCYGELGRAKDAYEMNEIALQYRPTDSRFLFNRLLLRDILYPGRQAKRPIRLNLGSGGKTVPTYRNTDLFPSPGVQELFDMGKIPYETGTVHAIYCEHALEHLSHQAARKAVAEWARVLRYGGDLILKVPDLNACCKKLVSASETDLYSTGNQQVVTEKEWYRYTIYGYQKGPDAEPAENQYHKTGFTQTELQNLLVENGFEDISIKEYDGCFTPSLEAQATLKRQAIKVAWMLNSADEDYPTNRIRALNIHRWFLKNNISSEVFAGYPVESADALFSRLKFKDVVIFFRWGPLEVELMTKLQRAGILAVWDINEDVLGQDECINAANLVTCCSTALSQTLQRSRTVVIPDAYELPGKESPKEENAKLKVICCSMGGNQEGADALKPVIEKLGMQLIRISEWPQHEVKWQRETWLQELAKADIVITPQKHWLRPAKSNNRVTQAMALGLPVVASPLQSYKEAISHGETGLISETSEDWEKNLTLLQDKALREKIGKAAKEAVTNYSMEAIGKKWIEVFKELCCENCGSRY